MRDVIARVVDGSRFREFKKEYGTTMVTVSTFVLTNVSFYLNLTVPSLLRASRTYMATQLASLPTMASYSRNLR